MNVTKFGGTDTSEGFIPHMFHGGIYHPVALMRYNAPRVDSPDGFRLTTDSMGRPIPERTPGGHLIYATPGGGRMVV